MSACPPHGTEVAERRPTLPAQPTPDPFLETSKPCTVLNGSATGRIGNASVSRRCRSVSFVS